jgi:hypothetical protein
MTTIFSDKLQRNAHDLFQSWRRRNRYGVLINQKGKTSGLIHTASCDNHLGSPSWRQTKTDNDSLGTKPKICARTVGELRLWAKKHRVRVNYCRHCRPDDKSRTVEPLQSYASAVNEILLDAESEPLATEFEGVESPGRKLCQVFRTLRQTRVALHVKAIHRHACQICGTRIQLPDGEFYSEAHHIRPLGGEHKGPDKTENILCLCPNHHVQLDYGAIPIEVKKLRLHRDHTVNIEHVEYHNNHLFNGSHFL